MSSAVHTVSAPGLLARLIPSERVVRITYVYSAVVLLICSIIFPMHLQDRLPYNILPSLPISMFLIIGALAIRGPAVLRRSPFDWVMASWILLTVVSQIMAPILLNRLIFELETISVVLNVLTMWMIYRAIFAITIVDPQNAVKSTMIWLSVVILICTMIGILQSVGPVQQQMVDFAYRVGVGELAIKLGASEYTGVRTTSVFSGPNIFGFVNLIGASLMIGAAMAYRRNLREWHGLLVLAGLGLFAYANLNSQSRMSFVFAALLGLVFLIFLIRAAKWRALLAASVMFVVLSIATVVITARSDYDYMTKIFKTGVQKDESYRVRVDGLGKVAEVANDIPLFGAGQDRFSLVLYGRGDFYSRANGAGDNGLAMAYFLLGLPGVILLFAMNYVAWKALKQLRTEDRTFLKAIRHAGWLLFWLYLVSIPYAVRYHKLETFSYWLLVFGVIFALATVQQRRDRQIAMTGLQSDPGF